MNRRVDNKMWVGHAGTIVCLAGALRMGLAHLFDVSKFWSWKEAGVSLAALLISGIAYFVGILFARRGTTESDRSPPRSRLAVVSPLSLLWLDIFHARVGKLGSLGMLALFAAACLFLYLLSTPLCSWWEEKGASTFRIGNIAKYGDWLLAGLLTLIFFCFYYHTRYPGIGGRIHYGDSAEFQYLGLVDGISHPSGYPVYFLIVRALKQLLFFLPIYELVTLVSVLFGALAIGFTYLCAVKFSGSRSGSVVSSALLGVSLTFWCSATESEVYSLNSFFIAAVTFFTICFGLTKQYYHLYIGMFLYAISFGNHLTVLFLLPGILYLVLKTDPTIIKNYRALAIICGFVLVGVATYLYLYRLSHLPNLATYNTLGPNADLSTVFQWATATQYHNQMFIYQGHQLLTFKSRVVLGLFVNEFSIVGLLTLLTGVVVSIVTKQHSTIRRFLIISLVAHAFYAMNYNIPDMEVLFPAVYFFLVLLASTLFTNKNAILCKLALFVFLISYLIYNNWVNYGVGYTSNDAYFRTKEVALSTSIPNSIFIGSALTNYHTGFMLMYLSHSNEYSYRKFFFNAVHAKRARSALLTEEARRQLYPGKKEQKPIGGVRLSDYVASNKHHLMFWVTQNLRMNWWNTMLADGLLSLGSKMIKSQTTNIPYVGISLRGKMMHEKTGSGHRLAIDETDVPALARQLKEIDFKLISTTYGPMKRSYAGPHQGARSSIEIMGKEYGKGIEGVNLVVMDLNQMKVLSSKNFNTNKGNEYSSDALFIVNNPAVLRKR